MAIRDKHCVHLDFHTSHEIENIGGGFDKEEFKQNLRTAGIDSITLFAKCHHGNMYYYSEKYYTHPHLVKPLLDLQLEACREIGVSAKIYISAGLDEYSARTHPEWLTVGEDGTPQNMLKPYFHHLCFNTPYLDLLVGQTKEVTAKYMPDGLFFDIVSPEPCCCPACRAEMARDGRDWHNHADVMAQAEKVFRRWVGIITETVHAIKPDALVFFNAGDYPTGQPFYADCNDQLEAESLPTGGWGYDHFPMVMANLRRKGKNCIGMTGKFHKTWGEFGGFKYKNALLYEGAQCVALGAGLSVGDQLHPSAKLDAYTYENVGNAVAYMKEREPWRGGEYLPEFAVFAGCHTGRSGESRGRTGLCRMLFEEKYQFDLIDYTEVSNKYPLIVMADEQYELCDEEYAALRAYVDNGGLILATGRAPLYKGEIAFDLGASFVGPDVYSPSYIHTDYPLAAANDMDVVLYTPFYQINVRDGGRKLADQVQPYFKREFDHFSSHNNTPPCRDKRVPVITAGRDGIYVACEICTDYARTGSLSSKQVMLPLLRMLHPNVDKTVQTNLPAGGKALVYKKDDRYILHLLYANTVKRGEGVEVIEDLVTIADINVSLKLPQPITKAVLQPEGKTLALQGDGDRIAFTLDKFKCYAIVELIP